MKIYRLLSILTTLLNHDLVSAKDLAERNEVSIKTIQRDIDALNMAGIPVYSEKGMKGGYGILDTYKLDTKLLSRMEVGILNSMLEGLSAIYDNKQLVNLWEKLESASDPGQSDAPPPMKVDLSPWNEDETVTDKVKMLMDAMQQRTLVDIAYYNMEGIPSNRWIEPMALTMRNGRWYLAAYCRTKEAIRNFKVNRIKTMAMTDQHFNPRDVQAVDDTADAGLDDVKKVLRFDAAAYPRVVDIFNADEIEETADGHLTVTTYRRSAWWLMSMILSFGHQVEVLEPPALIDAVKEKINKMNQIYN